MLVSGLIIFFVFALSIAAIWFLRKHLVNADSLVSSYLNKLSTYSRLDNSIFQSPFEFITILIKRLSGLIFKFDTTILDNSFKTSVKPIGVIGLVLRKVHTGNIQLYIFYSLSALVIFYFIFRNL